MAAFFGRKSSSTDAGFPHNQGLWSAEEFTVNDVAALDGDFSHVECQLGHANIQEMINNVLKVCITALTEKGSHQGTPQPKCGD